RQECDPKQPKIGKKRIQHVEEAVNWQCGGKAEDHNVDGGALRSLAPSQEPAPKPAGEHRGYEQEAPSALPIGMGRRQDRSHIVEGTIRLLLLHLVNCHSKV